jgi:hypothetical protein
MTGNGNGIGSPRLIFMIDGLGSDYLDSGTTPFLPNLFTESVNWHLLLPFNDDHTL